MLIADRRPALLAWREMQKRGGRAVKLLMLSVRRDQNVHVQQIERCKATATGACLLLVHSAA